MGVGTSVYRFLLTIPSAWVFLNSSSLSCFLLGFLSYDAKTITDYPDASKSSGIRHDTFDLQFSSKYDCSFAF